VKLIQSSLSVISLVLFLEVQAETGLAEQMHWRTYGPNGPISIFALDPQDPNNLYASSYGALFKSIDQGANWHILNPGVLPGRTGAIAVDPHNSLNLYVASGLDVYIADCGECGQRVFDKLFPQNHRVRSTIEFDKAK
jgi:photosystem II stability/assembly factor-like uncharacterized protein